MSKTIKEIIILDVHRSFSSNKYIDHSSLIEILQVYAGYNPKVEYCQGMNFIVGYLYLLLQDNAQTFNFLRQLITKYGMENLYSQDVPLLKELFYQMDRLLYFFYPEITAFFRNEGIKANFFSPSWFITLFTNSLQYSTEEMPSDLLLEVWDVFLLYGWKAIFKVGIFIVNSLMEKLIEARTDHIMMIFGTVPNGSFFKDPEVLTRFRNEFKRIGINNGMLESLSKEYAEIIGKANNIT